MRPFGTPGRFYIQFIKLYYILLNCGSYCIGGWNLLLLLFNLKPSYHSYLAYSCMFSHSLISITLYISNPLRKKNKILLMCKIHTQKRFIITQKKKIKSIEVTSHRQPRLSIEKPEVEIKKLTVTCPCAGQVGSTARLVLWAPAAAAALGRAALAPWTGCGGIVLLSPLCAVPPASVGIALPI